MSKLVTIGYDPTLGFFARAAISTICIDQSSREAIIKLRQQAQKELLKLAFQIEKDCLQLLMKDQTPCSEPTPRNYHTAFQFDTHSCLGDKW